MKKASITEAKNNLSALIDRVKGGSPVLIVDRGRPVARLEPVTSIGPEDDPLARLVHHILRRSARGEAPKTVVSIPPPRAEEVAFVVRALPERSQDGR